MTLQIVKSSQEQPPLPITIEDMDGYTSKIFGIDHLELSAQPYLHKNLFNLMGKRELNNSRSTLSLISTLGLQKKEHPNFSSPGLYGIISSSNKPNIGIYADFEELIRTLSQLQNILEGYNHSYDSIKIDFSSISCCDNKGVFFNLGKFPIIPDQRISVGYFISLLDSYTESLKLISKDN